MLNATTITSQSINNQSEWRYVKDSKIITTSSGRRAEAHFSVSDYGYDVSKFKFRRVELNAQATGDLDGSHEYLEMYFNSIQVGKKWNSGVSNCAGSLYQVDSYPIQKQVEASTFTFGVFASFGTGCPKVQVTLTKFQVMKK